MYLVILSCDLKILSPIMLSLLYYFTIFVCFPIIHFLIPNLTKHGRISSGISKNYFVLFYLYGLILSLYKGISNIFFIHFLRRLIECLCLRYKRSKMNIVQFLHGIIYYTFLISHLQGRKLSNPLLFVILNVLQSIAHIRIFLYSDNTYCHYYLEILIYLYVFYKVKTLEMLFNLFYVIAFVCSSISNRHVKKMIKN